MTSITPTFLAPSDATVTNPPEISGLFRIHLISSAAVLTSATYTLENLVSFKTNFDTCYASKITLCTFQTCSSPIGSGGNIEQSSNPAVQDTPGFVKASLSIVRQGNFISTIYFKGENFDGSITSLISAEVIVCITDKIVLSGDG